MKKILLFALPLLAMLSVSCEKDNGKNRDDLETTKLVKAIYLDGELWYDFKYDEQGRIVSMGTGLEVEYTDDAIIFFTGNYTTCTLDNNGYVVEVRTIIDEKDYVRKYEYSNGYLSKIIDVDNADEQSFVWVDGNIHPSDVEVEYSNIVNITNFDFNYILAFESVSLAGIKCKGISSKNLIQKCDGWSYSYKLDEDGAPIRITDIDGTTLLITYVD